MVNDNVEERWWLVVLGDGHLILELYLCER
jgi:hypothetical protein